MHTVTRSCVLILWMLTLTFVKSQDCTLEQFQKGPHYDTNFDITGLKATYPGGSQVRVNCNIGHTGFFKLLCVEGSWQPRGAKCQPRSCGHPGDATFADFHLEEGSDFVFGSKVVYKCHTGYQMVSRTNHRHCMAGGWDGIVPVCEAQQCQVLHVMDNILVNGDIEEATFGNVVHFSCKHSNEVLRGSQKLYCNEHGEWSSEAPICEEIKCPAPEIENGYVRGAVKVFKADQFLHYDCNQGFRRVDNRTPKCAKQGIRAEWTVTPACELIQCKLLLLSPKGTSYEPNNRNVFSPGDTLQVTCEEKYWISDRRQISAVSTCRATGEWSVEPICQEVTCTNIRHSSISSWSISWRQTIKLGDTITYSCKDSYKSTDANGRATCTRNGWNPDPLCQEITCDRYDFENADIVNYRAKYFYNEQANYKCKEGYDGEFYLICRENGWRGTPRCTEKSCKRLDISQAYIFRNDKKIYSSKEKVQYVCSKYENKRFTIVCDKGVWSNIQSCTVDSDCPEAEVPHGFVVGPYNETVYYTCDDGYKSVTKGWWGKATCDGGVWSGLQPCIEKRHCVSVPEIPNGNMMNQLIYYEEGKNVQIVCKEGYSSQIDRMTCVKGKWYSFGTPFKDICSPAANHCSPPPKVANAVVVTSYQKEYVSGSEVTYQCRQNHKIQGEATLRCTDGKWDERTIECTPLALDQ